MRFIIDVDENLTTETDVRNFEYELYHVVRKYSDFVRIMRKTPGMF